MVVSAERPISAMVVLWPYLEGPMIHPVSARKGYAITALLKLGAPGGARGGARGRARG